MDLYQTIRHANPMKLKVKTRVIAPGEDPVLTAVAGRTIPLVQPGEGSSAPQQQVLNPEPLRSFAVDPLGQPQSDDVNSADISIAAEVAMEEGDKEEEVRTRLRRKRKNVASTSLATSKVARKDTGESSHTEKKPIDLDEDTLSSSAKEMEDTTHPRSPTPPIMHESPSKLDDNVFETDEAAPIYIPEWAIPTTSTLSTKADCKDLLDNITPPGRKSVLAHMSDADLLGEINMVNAHQITLAAHLRDRYVHHIPLVHKLEERDEEIAQLKEQLAHMEGQVAREKMRADLAAQSANKAREEKMKALVDLAQERGRQSNQQAELSWLTNYFKQSKAQFSVHMAELREDVAAQLDAQEEKLRGMSIDFDEELYPQLMSMIAERRWLISRGMRLAAMNTLEDSTIVEAFGHVVNCAMEVGKVEAFEAAEKEKLLLVPAIDCPDYNAGAEKNFTDAMDALKHLNLRTIDRIEKDADQPMDVVMAGLILPRFSKDDAHTQPDYHLKPHSSQLMVPVFKHPRSVIDPFAVEKEIPLKEVLEKHAERGRKKAWCYREGYPHRSGCGTFATF